MHEQVDILTLLFFGACAMHNEYVLVNIHYARTSVFF